MTPWWRRPCPEPNREENESSTFFSQQTLNKIRQNPNQNRLTSLNLRNQKWHDDPRRRRPKRSCPNQRTKHSRKNESPLTFFQQTLNKIRQNPNQNLSRPKPPKVKYQAWWPHGGDDQRGPVPIREPNKTRAKEMKKTSHFFSANPNKISKTLTKTNASRQTSETKNRHDDH
jgi:hypothetical protein